MPLRGAPRKEWSSRQHLCHPCMLVSRAKQRRTMRAGRAASSEVVRGRGSARPARPSQPGARTGAWAASPHRQGRAGAGADEARRGRWPTRAGGTWRSPWRRHTRTGRHARLLGRPRPGARRAVHGRGLRRPPHPAHPPLLPATPRGREAHPGRARRLHPHAPHQPQRHAPRPGRLEAFHRHRHRHRRLGCLTPRHSG